MDLNISFSPDGSLNFDLFIKPTFTGSYLNSKSNHPKHTFRGIVLSLVSRIRRICSNLNDYLYHCSNLLYFLVKKGFSSQLILNIIRAFTDVKRDTLIEYKTKKNDFKDSIFFITTFDKNVNFSLYLKQIWNDCIPNDSFLKKMYLKTVYKMTII